MKKNPQDATRRNVQAVNKKVKVLTIKVRALEKDVKKIKRTCQRFLDIYGYT